MTTKHTPGPWKVYEDSHSDAYEVMPDQCDVGDTIAVYGRTRKANARLIAAAPDLLRALKVLTLEAGAGLIGDADPKALAQAREAIAKAEEG